MRQKTSPTQKALNIWAIILIIWSIYRANFRLPEWFDEFIAKPLVFIVPVYLYISRIEKKEFFSSLWWKVKIGLSDVLYGTGIGGILFLTAITGNWVKTGGFIFLQGKTPSISAIALLIAIAFATSIGCPIFTCTT